MTLSIMLTALHQTSLILISVQRASDIYETGRNWTVIIFKSQVDENITGNGNISYIFRNVSTNAGDFCELINIVDL